MYKKNKMKKDRLKNEANIRKENYDKLSIEEKIAKLPPEPHSQKQRTKLMAQLENKTKKLAPKQSEETEAPMKAKERKSKESRGE